MGHRSDPAGVAAREPAPERAAMAGLIGWNWSRSTCARAPCFTSTPHPADDPREHRLGARGRALSHRAEQGSRSRSSPRLVPITTGRAHEHGRRRCPGRAPARLGRAPDLRLPGGRHRRRVRRAEPRGRRDRAHPGPPPVGGAGGEDGPGGAAAAAPHHPRTGQDLDVGAGEGRPARGPDHRGRGAPDPRLDPAGLVDL